jgi:hypothetical protein
MSRTITVFLLLILAAAPLQGAHAAPTGYESRESGPTLEEEKQDLREDERELRERKRALRERERDRKQSRFQRQGPPPVWISLGLNQSNVTASDEGCGGSQGALSIGSVLMLRGEYTEISYESDDDTGTCDGIFSGDSGAQERAIMGGLLLGHSGLYIAGGPAAVSFDQTAAGPWGKDTGSRIEAGWTSRQVWNSPVNLEISFFRTDTEIRDYTGLAVNMTLGGKR